MLQLFYCRRGSTMVMVILTMTIIVTLGVAILSATTMGYNYKVYQNRQKTALYIAESGLEEAYAYLGEEVENAVNYSRNVYVLAQVAINQDTLVGLSDDDYDDQIAAYYEEGYKAYFIQNQGTIISNLTTSNLLGPQATGGVSGQNGERIVQITASIPAGGQYSDVNDVLLIDFTSRSTLMDLHGNLSSGGQTVRVRAALGIPDYDVPLSRKSQSVDLVRNALWDKAVVAGGNVYAYGDNVQVNGNLYARGRWDMEKEKIGGIIAGGEEALTTGTSQSVTGYLRVTGDAVTGQYLQTRYSRAGNPSRIQVDRDAVANSISTQIGEDELNEGSTIMVNGDAHIFDDTEINAATSQITISGNYFGFSSGTGTDHRESSSLLVNTDDIRRNTGSRLTVGGNGGDVTIKGITVPQGIYLSGTVYVDQESTYSYVDASLDTGNGSVLVLSNGMARYTPSSDPPPGSVSFEVDVDTYGTVERMAVNMTTNGLNPVYKSLKQEYQTGESVSVVGNYVGYTQKVTSWLPGDPAADVTEYHNISDANMTKLGPLNMVTTGNTGVKMQVQDKAKYAGYVYRQYPTIYNLGENDVTGAGNIIINTANVIYSLGRYITGVPNFLYDRFVENGDTINARTVLQKHYAHQINLLGDPQLLDYTANQQSTVAPVSGWLSDSWSTANINTSTTTANYYARGIDASPLILRGTGANTTALEARLSGETIVEAKAEGIILSKGDIYVAGRVLMDGLLMSEGDIYFLDDELKIISNTELGSPEADFVSTTNVLVDKVFDDLFFFRDAAGIGNLFRQAPLTAPNYSWTRMVSRRTELRDVYAGPEGENLNFAGSLESILRFRDWQWERH